MTVSVYDRLDKTETGFVRAMARELIVARYGNHPLEESEIEDAIRRLIAHLTYRFRQSRMMWAIY